MFLKPYKVKSHTQLKTSDKKRLRVLLSEHFPVLQYEEVNKLVPLKEDVSTMKIFCQKGSSVLAYMSGKCPVAFSHERSGKTVMLPSVYLCWDYAGLPLAPVFITSLDVLYRMQSGADLLMPGVLFKGQLSMNTFGTFEADTPAVIMCRGAVIAVGTTALSSTDMYMAGGRGKAVIVVHVVGDYLWAAGDKSMPSYRAPSSDGSAKVTSTGNSVVSGTGGGGVVVVETGVPGGATTQEPRSYSGALAGHRLQPSAPPQEEYSDTSPSSDDASIVTEGVASLAVGDEQQEVLNPWENMDDLLLHCLLKTLKKNQGKLELPILTATFYSQYIKPLCPDNATLDVKKSSYKKFTKFLEAMEAKKILEITQCTKDTVKVTAVNYEHEDITHFRYDKRETTAKEVTGPAVFVPPTMEDVYQVSGDTIEFYRSCGNSKGEVLTRQEVRNVVTTYITKKKLADPKTGLVNLEPPLHNAIVAPKEGLVRQLKWDQIFSRLLGRMSPAVRITQGNGLTVVRKGKIEAITMITEKRRGNKLVTLIHNVVSFGIDEKEFAERLQVRAAASANIVEAKYKAPPATDVLVQGNATGHVADLLINTYNIPKKYIKGMELIPKNQRK